MATQVDSKSSIDSQQALLHSLEDSASIRNPSMDGPPRGKKFYLFGFPVAHSTAPAFHNHFFKSWRTGTPNTYETWSTSRVTDDLVNTFLQDDFGGATWVLSLPLVPNEWFYLPESDRRRMTGWRCHSNRPFSRTRIWKSLQRAKPQNRVIP